MLVRIAPARREARKEVEVEVEVLERRAKLVWIFGNWLLFMDGFGFGDMISDVRVIEMICFYERDRSRVGFRPYPSPSEREQFFLEMVTAWFVPFVCSQTPDHGEGENQMRQCREVGRSDGTTYMPSVTRS